jgi:hypothetical protein
MVMAVTSYCKNNQNSALASLSRVSRGVFDLIHLFESLCYDVSIVQIR